MPLPPNSGYYGLEKDVGSGYRLDVEKSWSVPPSSGWAFC